MQRVVKPTTRKGKRIVVGKEPKIIENTKQTLFIQGRKTHETVWKCVKDFHLLKKPNGILMNKKNDVLPFENVSPVEKLCNKYDASLFMFASHNKKRPNNLVMGRMFDNHLLDMFEFGIDSFSGLSSFNCAKPPIGIKPCLLFLGEEFEQIHHMNRLKNLLVDMFHGQEIKSVPYTGIEYVMTFAAAENKIILKTYKILLTPSGEKSPRVELELMGPCVDFSLRRKILASDDLFKRACIKPKTKGKKIQNVKRDVFGSKLGRVHMTSQDVNKLQTRKMKGLRKSISERKIQRKRKASSTLEIPSPKSVKVA